MVKVDHVNSSHCKNTTYILNCRVFFLRKKIITCYPYIARVNTLVKKHKKTIISDDSRPRSNRIKLF